METAREAPKASEAEKPSENAAEAISMSEPPQLKVPSWIRTYIAILYIGLGPFLVCLLGGMYREDGVMLAWGMILGILLLAAVYPLALKKRYSALLGVTPELWITITALLLIPIAFVGVPWINTQPLDFGWASIFFNAFSLVLGGVALFMGLKDQK